MIKQFTHLKYVSLSLFFSLSIVFPALADICFLPNSECMSGAKLEELQPSADDDCAGYGPKMNGNGWDCSDTCHAHGHTYYRCVAKDCSPYTPGITSCERGYTYESDNSYSGDLKCGRCIEDKCPENTHLSQECEATGYMPVQTQYYVEDRPCYMCVDDNCNAGLKKKCDSETELALRVERTQYGSLCYKCCNNVCNSGSLDEPTCADGQSPQEISRTDCNKPCYECQ